MSDVSQKELLTAVRQACDWLVNIAQVKHAALEDDARQSPHVRYRDNILFPYTDWRGAIRGEYQQSLGLWWFYCPLWHTGQAVRALVEASQTLQDDSLLEAAKFSAEFILRNQVVDPNDEDFGLMYAYEDLPNETNTSAILESLSGLLSLYTVTHEEKYLTACKTALEWIARKAFMPDEGLLRDHYDPAQREFHTPPYESSAPGRPLVDDAMFLLVGNLTNSESLRDIHYRLSHRLMKDEYPSGNWLWHAPCEVAKSRIHPRQAYWWGWPFLESYRDTGERKYLDVAIRCGLWYVHAQRRDGGLFRQTYTDFSTDSFGHATSGLACAIKLWVQLYHETKDEQWLKSIDLGLRFCLKMQVRQATDPNLQGVIIEKILAPNGSDAPLIYIRDLGTIFFVQAICELLRSP